MLYLFCLGGREGKVEFSKRKIVKVSRKCGEKFLDINVAMNVLGLMMML